MSFLRETALIPDGFTSHNTNTSTEPLNAPSTFRHVHALRKYVSSSNIASQVLAPLDGLGRLVGTRRHGKEKEEEEQLPQVARRQALYLHMNEAADYQGWFKCAQELDILEGRNKWKEVDECRHYDADFVKERVRRLEEASTSCDVERMLHLIRTEFSRHVGDMSNLLLYKHTHVGTKNLVTKYIRTALGTIEKLLEVSAKTQCSADETYYIYEQIDSAQRAFGRSALLLSGGATYGMTHIGVLKALWEEGVLPPVISGASAGSIVCSVFCTHTDEQMPEVLRNFGNGNFAVFDDPGANTSVWTRIRRLLDKGPVFDIAHLKGVMKELLGDLTFREAYNLSRRVLNICVSSAGIFEMPRLLNYLTAPDVLIWSAVCASCSVPVLFKSASLKAKDLRTGKIGPWNPTQQQWIDGSVDNDIPVVRIAEMFNVNNFIVSQVNPHVVPFLRKEEYFIGQDATDAHVPSRFRWLQTWTDLAKDEALYRVLGLAELGVWPHQLTKLYSIVSQKYVGDINIYPAIPDTAIFKIFANPTPEFMRDACSRGEKATWPKIDRIRNSIAIELALDDAVNKLKERVIFSPSQVELRMNLLNSAGAGRGGRGRGQGVHRHRRGIRSNESIVFRNKGRLASQGIPVHHESGDDAMPSIPGSPDSSTLLELLNRLRDEAIKQEAGYEEASKSDQAWIGSTRPRPRRAPGLPSRQSSIDDGSTPPTRGRSDSDCSTLRGDRGDDSDSGPPSPGLVMKTPTRSQSQSGIESTSSSSHIPRKPSLHLGTLPPPLLPVAGIHYTPIVSDHSSPGVQEDSIKKTRPVFPSTASSPTLSRRLLTTTNFGKSRR